MTISNSEIRADESDVREHETALKTTPHLNDMKNNSLYAGLVDGVFRKPSEVVTQDDAIELIHITNDRLKYIQAAEERTRINEILVQEGSIVYQEIQMALFSFDAGEKLADLFINGVVTSYRNSLASGFRNSLCGSLKGARQDLPTELCIAFGRGAASNVNGHASGA
jgi:hypothetical protein